MKILYRIFLIILIFWWVSMWIYWLTWTSLFEFIPKKIIFWLSLDSILHILIWISAIIVLLSNFSISFKPKDK